MQNHDKWTLPAIVHALRDATREAHDRLDANSPVFAPDLDLYAYHEILGRYLTAHRALEQALEPWATSLARRGVSLDERRKVPLLLLDRARTTSGLSTDDDEHEPTFALPTLASAWGALYVMEGSTLGGQHILRALETSALARREGLTRVSGLAYFTGYASRTGEMWRQFLSALGEADVADTGGRDAIIDGARSAFALFERVLSGSASSHST